MIAGLLDHLWQSTLFAGGAGLLTLMLRHNPARLRFTQPVRRSAQPAGAFCRS